MRMRSAVVPFVVSLLFVAAPAAADPPSANRVAGSGSITLPAGAVCAFPVRIDVDQNFKLISFAEPIGQGIAALTAGRIKAVVTDLATGASVWLDISGPAFLAPNGVPVFGTGQTLLFTDDGLLHAAGRVTRDDAGEFHIDGRTRNVCAMLSG